MSVMTGNNNNGHNQQSTAPAGAISGNSSPLGIMSPAASAATSGKKWRYYKLSRSKRSIMYGEFSEKIAPVLKSYEKLPHRIDLSSVNEIKPIRKASTAGLNTASPQIFNSNGLLIDMPVSQNTSNTSFALYTDKNMIIAEFYCSSATQAAEWKDGFSMLLDKRFTSKETAEIFHTLTEVGVKVKLLQIAGDRVEIPHGVVEVPPVPIGLGSGFFYDSIEL
jgi:engulfment/cell motility protein 1